MKELVERYAAIIVDHEIETWEIQPSSSRLKATIKFIDDSALFIKEYVFLRNGKTRKYAYHWQDKDGQLLSRWDNAAHWKSVSTFPHHKHEGEEFHVIPSREVSLEDVLRVIAEKLDG